MREEKKKMTQKKRSRYELRNSGFWIINSLSVDDAGWNKNGALVIVLSRDAGVVYHHFDQLWGRIDYEGVYNQKKIPI